MLCFVLLALPILGCAEAPILTPTPAPPEEEVVTEEEAAPPAPTPTLATIPEEILASHFGFGGLGQDMDGISRLGIRWGRSPSIPFIWGLVEPERGEYIWRRTDGYVHNHQDYNFAVIAVIWPLAEWDQANWGPAGTSPIVFEDEMGRSRRKPYDMDAYRRFVSAVVERYDGDGIDDMPGLKYPIKYWEASNEPSLQTGFWTFFNGSSEDYLEVLKATYQAVKEADPEAKVLAGGMGTMKPQQVSFWRPVFKKGSQYFDAAYNLILEFVEGLVQS